MLTQFHGIKAVMSYVATSASGNFYFAENGCTPLQNGNVSRGVFSAAEMAVKKPAAPPPTIATLKSKISKEFPYNLKTFINIKSIIFNSNDFE